MVFNIFPVAVLGLAFYVFMVAINTPWAWRSGIKAIWWARLAGIITGMGFVLYLIYAEVIQIGNLCLDCTTVHIITFLLFGLLIFAATFNTTTLPPAAATLAAVTGSSSRDPIMIAWHLSRFGVTEPVKTGADRAGGAGRHRGGPRRRSQSTSAGVPPVIFTSSSKVVANIVCSSPPPAHTTG